MTLVHLVQIVVLAFVQGLAELLPVSSSAHVIVAAKLMGIDPKTPQFTLLLVMLHTGTMFAVIVYFWKAWRRAFFTSQEGLIAFVKLLVIATAVTGVLGLTLQWGIEGFMHHRDPTLEKAQIEDLFGNLTLIAVSLAAAGVLILYAGLRPTRRQATDVISKGDSLVIGAIQGLCLPFRGFSRSGATISVGMVLGIARTRAEEFSFALAVVLTPAIVVREAWRLVHHHAETTGTPLSIHDFAPSLLGMIFSFLGGLLALKLLSGVLEQGRWWVFGVYCLVAAAVVFGMAMAGY